MGLGHLWDQLVDCVCRPPRDTHYTAEDLYGGATGSFSVVQKGRIYHGKRTDLELVNKRGQRLKCSHFVPLGVKGRDGRLPCVVYCHCNSGSRRDSFEALEALLPSGIGVFALDFSGSGLSEGDWVTLGAHEVDDLEVAVAHLRDSGAVSTLGLWGRSMGAVTALLYAQRDPSIAGIVLDSPFSSLTALMMEIVEEQELPIPKALMRVALAAMKRSVRKRAGFDISQVCPLSVAPESFTPALFCHASGDTFVRIHHSEQLHAAYAGDKNLIKVEGDHNSPRPSFFASSAAIFFNNTLQLDQMLLSTAPTALDFAALAAVMPASLEALDAPTSPTHTATVPWNREPLRNTSSALLRREGYMLPGAEEGSGGSGRPVAAQGSGRRSLAETVLQPPSGKLGGSDDEQGLGSEEAEEREAEEELLMAAIHASLRDAAAAAAAATAQQIPPEGGQVDGAAAAIAAAARSTDVPSTAAATGPMPPRLPPLALAPAPGTAQGAVGDGGSVRWPSPTVAAPQGGLAPLTEDEEEAMLQQAIAMSLREGG